MSSTDSRIPSSGSPDPSPPPSAPPAVQSFLTALLRLEIGVAVMAVSLSAVALFADLLAREIFSTGLFGSLRIAVFSVAVASLLGFAVCVGTNSHMRIGLLDRLIPSRSERAYGRLSSAVSAVIAGFLTYYAWIFVSETRRVNEVELSLGIPLWPIQLVLIWAFGSACVRHFLFALWPDLQPSSAEVTA